MARPAKEAHRLKLIEFMADTDNPWPTRADMPKILNITAPTLYHHFPPSEIVEIEAEGLALRRKRCAKTSAVVDAALIEKCKSGDPAAIKLYYQKIEAWSEKNIQENTFDERTLRALLSVLPPEYLEAIQKKIGA